MKGVAGSGTKHGIMQGHREQEILKGGEANVKR